MPPKKVYRAYGLQCPLNAWQILVICFHVINAVIFYFGISLKFNVVYFSIYTFFCTIAVGAWFYTSSVDAALAPSKCEKMLCLPLYCFKKAHLKKRYCAVTRKTVPGMDHYCRWMNTAIGSRNYVGFFSVIFTSTILFTFQGIFAIISFILINFTANESGGDNVVLLTVCCILLFLGSIGGLSSHGVLCIFHCYLIRKQFGTYDYLIERSKQKREKMKKLKEQNKAANNNIEVNDSNGVGNVKNIVQKSNRVKNDDDSDDNRVVLEEEEENNNGEATAAEEKVPSII